MSRISILFLAVLLCIVPRAGAGKVRNVSSQILSATAELFIMNPRVVGFFTDKPFGICGAFNVEKTSNGYLLETAAHCIQLEGAAAASSTPIQFAVKYAESGDRPVYLPVQVVLAGDEYSTDRDIAVIRVQDTQDRKVLSFGSEKKLRLADTVINCSAPDGFILQVNRGLVGALYTGIKNIGEAHQWFVVFGVGPGSSGSAVVSEKQDKVVAMVNIGDDGKGFTGVPASKLKSFLLEALAGARN